MEKIRLSKMVRIIRENSIDPRRSFQEILTFLFATLTNNSSFFVESTSSSRIMNNEYDVPHAVRKIFNECDEKEKDKRILYFVDSIIDDSKEDALFQKIKEIASSSNLSERFKTKIINDTNCKDALSRLLKAALLADNRKTLNKDIYEKNGNVIRLISGDIIALGFNKKGVVGDKIVVINVDEKFTMEFVDENGLPAIDKTSVHGQWLKRMIKQGYTKERILKETTFVTPSEGCKIGKIRFEKTLFYLLPISRLNERNTAHSDIRDVEKTLNALAEEYGAFGQSVPMYTTLVGTGKSRLNANLSESITLIKNAFTNSKEGFFGCLNIVVPLSLVDELEAYK